MSRRTCITCQRLKHTTTIHWTRRHVTKKAVNKFNKYLGKFPNGRYAYEVKNYLADCHFILGNTEQAINLYIETLEGPNSGFTEIAASRVSKHLFNNGQYEESIRYYKRLEQISSTPEVIFNAKLGLMRANFLVENWSNSSVYADKVLDDSQLNNELKLEAYYAKGMSNFYLNDFAKAKNGIDMGGEEHDNRESSRGTVLACRHGVSKNELYRIG